MRIGYDAKRLFNNFTGLGNYSRFIVKAIRNHNFSDEVFLFTPRIKQNAETKEFLDQGNYFTVQPASWISTLKLGSYWRTALLKREAAKHKLDIFHGMSHELPAGITSVCKSVVTIHDLIFLRFPELYSPIDRWIYTRKVKYACATADIIIAISEQTKQDLINFLQIPAERIKVVYQGCHPNFHNEISEETKREVRKRYALPERFILNVGTIEPRKNALLILKAMALLPESERLPLVIVGRPTKYVEQIKSFAEANQLTNLIIYLNKIDFKDLPAIYNLSELFVYPSIFEGFGIPLVEAIACKTPVITSTGSCFTEAAGPYAKYIVPDNAKALAEAMQQIINNPTLREEMVTKSFQHIQKFSEEKIAADMMAVYQSLM
ncbi:glycosyltransferase family 1 protein [Chryseotalea sanaruensis]|uniref:Glycosyltransferase family 1 protein n=1 Tax=Chryseotalea sanaruensis TaxID=2482724 RepID=A0A401UDV1_9BACT|nr:glycosyltransferase family 1 protein [Chryseotalea sanaruensis]GCC53063.1 glycosyltransferase family 1 protein [Chryseotalea sanaruensis]